MEQMMQLMLQVMSNQSGMNPSNGSAAKPAFKPMCRVVPEELTGDIVRVYQSSREALLDDPEAIQYGYILVEETDTKTRGLTRVETKRRTALIKGREKDLNNFLKKNKGSLIFPGRIVIQEFKESEIPQNFADEFFGDLESGLRDPDEAIAPYIKKSNADGVELLRDGERIFSFKFYTEEDESVYSDIILTHDNRDEVRYHSREQRAKRLEDLKSKEEARLRIKKELEMIKTAEVVDTETVVDDSQATLPDNN